MPKTFLVAANGTGILPVLQHKLTVSCGEVVRQGELAGTVPQQSTPELAGLRFLHARIRWAIRVRFSAL